MVHSHHQTQQRQTNQQNPKSEITPTVTRILPIYDVFLDLPHPAASNITKNNAIIIAPPPGQALEASRSVGIEVARENGLARVARFSFPEFDDKVYAKEVAENANPGDHLNKYDVHLSTISGPSYHSFAMQLDTGGRVYGHVRRYLPHHPVAKSRIDVGRRSLRAMVIVTRADGGENFYFALLKSMDAILSQKTLTPPDSQLGASQAHSFLHTLHTEHARLCANYVHERSQKKTTEASYNLTNTFSKAQVITIPGVEFGDKNFHSVDTSKFVIPQALIHPYSKDDTFLTSTSLILPLFRCLGVMHGLRFVSALLCERRIILTSQSPSRLSACARAAVSILSQGLLHWQHIYIPVMPPGMFHYLAAPYPYLIGIISNHANAIPNIPGLGEVVVVDLDLSDIATFNISNPESVIPDLLRGSMDTENGAEKFSSSAHVLSSDLTEILKIDKRFRNFGESAVQERVGRVAEKGKEFFKKSLGKLKGKGKKKIQPSNGSSHGMTNSMSLEEQDENEEEAAVEPLQLSEENYFFGEGLENEGAEAEVRIAFTAFFVSLVGNMRWYLRPLDTKNPGGQQVFDKNLFLEERKKMGDVEGTPMYTLLYYFKETQFFSQFVETRIKEVLSRNPISPDAPLYLLACHHHRMHRIGFHIPDIRKVVRQVSHTNPNRFLIDWNITTRKRAMALTSNSRNDATLHSELKRLVQDCRESTYILKNVMSVIWERIRDSRGMQWKHALYALTVLLELILHGPLTVISDATDGLAKVRALKFYENMRPIVVQQVRSISCYIYDLLVHRSKLFNVRRACALRRKEEESEPSQTKKVQGIVHIRQCIPMDFLFIHKKISPNTNSSVTTVESADLLNTDFIAHNVPTQGSAPAASYANDLLAFDFAVGAKVTERKEEATADIGVSQGFTGTSSVTSTSAPNASDLIYTPQHLHVPNEQRKSTTATSTDQQLNPQEWTATSTTPTTSSSSTSAVSQTSIHKLHQPQQLKHTHQQHDNQAYTQHNIHAQLSPNKHHINAAQTNVVVPQAPLTSPSPHLNSSSVQNHASFQQNIANAGNPVLQHNLHNSGLYSHQQQRTVPTHTQRPYSSNHTLQQTSPYQQQQQSAIPAPNQYETSYGHNYSQQGNAQPEQRKSLNLSTFDPFAKK